jgi:hypothetical protein
VDRDVFAERLARAARRAVEFAREFVENSLPDAIRFRVRLNSSYDANPLHPDERVYPKDGARYPASELTRVDQDTLVRLLWRGGAVPEWVNLTVIDEDGEATVVEAMCCGRFTANDAILYHRHEGWPPFHVLGPHLPNDWAPGSPRFSLRWDSTATSPAELKHLLKYARKVQQLGVEGPWCRDDDLAALDGFSALRTLRLKGTQIGGPGLRHVYDSGALIECLTLDAVGKQAGMKSIRRMFLSNTNVTDASLATLSQCERLERVDVRGTRVTRAEVRALAAALPELHLLADGWNKLPRHVFEDGDEQE